MSHRMSENISWHAIYMQTTKVFMIHSLFRIWAVTWQNQQSEYVPSED